MFPFLDILEMMKDIKNMHLTTLTGMTLRALTAVYLLLPVSETI